MREVLTGRSRMTFPQRNKNELRASGTKKHHDGMMEAGWTCDDGTYFYGPLSVEEVEFEYPYDPV